MLSIIVEIVSRPSRGCQCKIVHGLFCASANRSARLLDTDSRQSIFQNRLHGVPPVGVHRSLCRHLLHGPLRVEKQSVIHIDTIILTLFTLLSLNFYKNQIVLQIKIRFWSTLIPVGDPGRFIGSDWS